MFCTLTLLLGCPDQHLAFHICSLNISKYMILLLTYLSGLLQVPCLLTLVAKTCMLLVRYFISKSMILVLTRFSESPKWGSILSQNRYSKKQVKIWMKITQIMCTFLSICFCLSWGLCIIIGHDGCSCYTVCIVGDNWNLISSQQAIRPPVMASLL